MIAPVISPLSAWTHLARWELLAASRRLAEVDDVPGTRAEGQLIRPLVAMAGLRGREPSDRFWNAVLSIQLAHEASLLHDDVIDGAATRRGRPTVSAERGVARALLAGDHLLTAAYRAAAATGSIEFVARFTRSVERTVAGEAAQGRASGRTLELAEYEGIVLAKSGELLGCALATAAALDGGYDHLAVFELGRRIGLLYQMLDDLLDYCPLADTGKAPFGDYEGRRWTWVLAELDHVPFGLSRDRLLTAIFSEPEGILGVERCRKRMIAETDRLLAELGAHLPGDTILRGLLHEWLERANGALDRELSARGPGNEARAEFRKILLSRVPDPDRTTDFFGRNSKSFRFAARLFGPTDAARVARVYAYCRVTDDLVDRPPQGDPETLLDTWLGLSAAAYGGEPSGIPLIDVTMREMAEMKVPLAYAEELAEGMRMDLRGIRYSTMEELGTYTYRVASVVGLWITRLAGRGEPWLLDQAARMGGAMQMTNILRDVGEDLRAGRLYLPAECLDRHNLSEADLRGALEGGPLPAGYALLVEELLTRTEGEYRLALTAVPALPPSFARPVAVAAHLYRGIHREIRRSRYDNLRRRARTGPVTKTALAGLALWRLQLAISRSGAQGLTPTPAWAGQKQ